MRLFCLVYVLIRLIAFSNALRKSNRNKFDFGALATGVVGAMLGATPQQPPKSAQSAEALKESQGYAAIQAQQSVSDDARGLEDELLKMQEKIRNYDQATYQERQEISMKIKAQKLKLLTAISRATKIIRASYTMAYPEKKGLPIIIVPKDATDDDTLRASKLEEEGLKEAAQGIFSPCAEVAQELQTMTMNQKQTENEFAEQAEALSSLPLDDRLSFDEEKLFYWGQKIDSINHSIAQDEAELGITKTPEPSAAASAASTAAAFGAGMVNLLIPQPPPNPHA